MLLNQNRAKSFNVDSFQNIDNSHFLMDFLYIILYCLCRNEEHEFNSSVKNYLENIILILSFIKNVYVVKYFLTITVIYDS